MALENQESPNLAFLFLRVIILGFFNREKCRCLANLRGWFLIRSAA